MYNIRNTNWRRRSDTKNMCWLKADPMVDEGNDGCENDRWFTWHDRYYLEKDANYHNYYLIPINGGARFPLYGLSNPRNGLDYEAEFSNYPQRLKGQLTLLDNVVRSQNPNDKHRRYAVHFLDGERISHEEFLRAITRDPASAQRESKQYGTYWRFITTAGLYDKSDSDYQGAGLTCVNGADIGGKCGDPSPKELRFCSSVLYTSPYRGVAKVCSIMTNFMK